MKRILILDDELLVRRALARMLQTLGLDFFQAETLEDAGKILQQDHPSHVLIDLTMFKNESLEEVCSFIRNLVPDIKLIACTGDPRASSLAPLFDAMLMKPFSLSSLESSLNSH